MLDSYSPPPVHTTSILMCPLGERQTNGLSACVRMCVCVCREFGLHL